MPTKYRKKPVEIEAVRWDGTAEGATPIINWALSTGDFEETWASYHARAHGYQVRYNVGSIPLTLRSTTERLDDAVPVPELAEERTP